MADFDPRQWLLRTTVRRGYFETEYGNVAYVASATSKSGKDIDSGDRVPVSMVDFSKPVKVQR